MQKVNYRAQYAVKRAQQLAARRKAYEEWESTRNEHRQFNYGRKQFTDNLRNAKQARREDWEMGAIAPRRDFGSAADQYGLMQPSLLQGNAAKTMLGKYDRPWLGSGRFASVKRHKKEGWQPTPVDTVARTRRYEQWMQTESYKKFKLHSEREDSKKLEYWLKPDYVKEGSEIRKGDQVVIVKGQHVGQIATVQEADPEDDFLMLKNLYIAEMHQPQWMLDFYKTPDATNITRYPVAIHPSHVLLVREIAGRFIIVEKMWLERNWLPHKNQYEVVRYYPGLRTRIDEETPEKEKEEEAEEDEDYKENAEVHSDDTFRITSEQITFVPSLIASPMPGGVIDELRGKRSRFRTRHDAEYIQKKEAEDTAVEERNKTANTMRTPLMDVNKLIYTEAKAVFDKRVEADGSLESIGRKVWETVTANQANRSSPRTTG